MKKKFDTKSILVGLVVGIAVMFAIGAGSSNPTVGRYQIGGTASQALVIDTATGKVWTRFTPSGSGSSDDDFANPKLNK